MKRTALRADPEKTRAWQQRSRKPLPRRSAKQIAIDAERRKIKAAKLAAQPVCAARDLVPEIPCGSPTSARSPLEMHEIVKRSRWRMGAIDPTNSLLLCPNHHDWTEAEPARATAVGLLKARH